MDFDFDTINVAVASVFGSTVTYKPKGKPAFALPSGGVFDEAAKTIEFDQGVPLTTEHPLLGVRAADFPTYPAQPRQGDGITVKSQAFYITDVRDDSHGWIYLVLEQQSGKT